MSARLEFDGLSVSPTVIETIVRIAAEGVDGVASVGGTPITGAAAVFKPKMPSVEVSASEEGEELDVAVYLTAVYGENLTDLGAAVQKAIIDALGSQLGVEKVAIDVYIESLDFTPTP
ncbi:MAG: Asp23/Gls24 family envelope stress response protein [Coriobacteriia bacterium]|nr:Asp23/Gls24 family envelope stress response protein [Coriobacteriia bacterium]MCL2536843.1 Asp23/Gls24 family envelope stress response protein [Coriobacteriia bacterium]